MKEILISIVQGESDAKNITGWLVTLFTVIVNHIENVNSILTAVLTSVSILWVIVKIILAIRNRDKNDSNK